MSQRKRVLQGFGSDAMAAFKRLIKLAARLIEKEKTPAGRVNLFGILLAFALIMIVALPPIFEAAIRLIRPEVEVSVLPLPLFVAFVVFVLLCALLLAYRDGDFGERTND